VAELAERPGVDARYAREWLEQQAAAGLLDVESPASDADARRYRLPAAHAEVLLDVDHPAHAGPPPGGTALRPGTVRRWADQAGFASLRELPVDHLFWRLYELRG
jgi:hypothetical protein